MIADLLSRLDQVTQRGHRFSAKCPAHDDRSPSLSIAEGEKGVLVHCFGGCSVDEICRSLGLELKDLFYDAGLPDGQRPIPKPPRLNRVALAFRFEMAAFDHLIRAQHILDAATIIDVSILNEPELDLALRHVGHAYSDRERAELFEAVADSLREKAFVERSARERTPSAA